MEFWNDTSETENVREKKMRKWLTRCAFFCEMKFWCLVITCIFFKLIFLIVDYVSGDNGFTLAVICWWFIESSRTFQTPKLKRKLRPEPDFIYWNVELKVLWSVQNQNEFSCHQSSNRVYMRAFFSFLLLYIRSVRLSHLAIVLISCAI